MVKYPIGIQTFEKIRNGGYLYIDKTRQVFDLVSKHQYVFLSRPRRFGKSLLTSTLDAYFSGQKELFQGLAIEQLETVWEQHPVLHFSLDAAKQGTPEDLNDVLNRQLRDYEQQYDVKRKDEGAGTRLATLTQELFLKTGHQVVILIDEYDAPMLTVLHDKGRLEVMRTALQSFYAPLKSLDPYLRFVFITGITKFSQLSIFSQINNLEKVSMYPEYADICGITQDELEANFEEGIRGIEDYNHLTREETIAQLKQMYDGYHFSDGGAAVYNPFSLLSAMKTRRMDNYWFATGTPRFLISQIKRFNTDITQIDGSEALVTEFDAPTEDMHSILPLFYQSGYLTIKDYDRFFKVYKLGFPNEEVKIGLTQMFIPFYVSSDINRTNSACVQICKALMNDDIDSALEAAKSYFASIPYQEGTLKDAPTSEGHFAAMLYVMFSFLSLYVFSQVRVATGRLDILLMTQTTIYVMELKLDGTVEEALRQIDDKGYMIAWQADGRRVVKVGIAFSKEERTIKEWKAVEPYTAKTGEE